MSEVPRQEWPKLPEKKLVRLGDILSQIQAIVADDPRALTYPVQTEGCDCLGPCSGVEVYEDSNVVDGHNFYVLFERGAE